MSIVSPNLSRPTFSANTTNKVAFREDGDKSLTAADRKLIESGWGNDTKTPESSEEKMSMTKKVLIGAGIAVAALLATLRIANPETVKAFTESKNWVPNFLKNTLNKTSEFLHKYTFGANSQGAWGSLFGRTKAVTNNTQAAADATKVAEEVVPAGTQATADAAKVATEAAPAGTQTAAGAAETVGKVEPKLEPEATTSWLSGKFEELKQWWNSSK